MTGELLDSGYQMVCSVTAVEFREIADWLASQAGHQFENGDVITGIDSFQIVGGNGPYYSCVAVVRVAKEMIA